MVTHVRELTSKLNKTLPWFLADPDPRIYLRAPWLCLDLETTNKEKGSALVKENRVVCAAWSTDIDRHIKCHFGDELNQPDLMADIDMILKGGGFIIAHNAKFELQWLKRAGLDLRRVIVYDTMIGDYVRAGNRRWKLALGAVNKRYGGTGKEMLADALISGGVCPSEIDPAMLRARVTKDVSDTIFVFLRQRRALVQEKKLSVMFTRCLLTPVLADIETVGNHLDKARVYEEYEKALLGYEQVTREINEFTGQMVAKLPETHPLRELAGNGPVNPRSGPQMAYFLYDILKFKEITKYGKPVRGAKSKRFPEGAPKSDEDTLLALFAKTKQQRAFLEMKRRSASFNSKLTRSLNFYKGVIDEHDGLWFGSFNQCITQTHRLSSNGRKLTFATQVDDKGKPKTLGIQLQNQAREFKDLTSPRKPGNVMGNGDGSQLEFRVAAFLGQDVQAIHNIRTDVDQHALTGSVIEPEAWANGDKATRKSIRDRIKPHTFKPLYGGKYGTEDEMRYYAWFREQFPELAKTQEGWTFTVLKTKALRMPWGMTFYWPFTRMHPDGFIDNTPSIYNYPVQSFATADIIPIALVYLWHRIPYNAPDIEITNTVHDSVAAEFPPARGEMWKQLCAQSFTMDVYFYLKRVYKVDFNVPLGVGVSIGPRWNAPESVEVEWNVEADGEAWAKGDRRK